MAYNQLDNVNDDIDIIAPQSQTPPVSKRDLYSAWGSIFESLEKTFQFGSIFESLKETFKFNENNIRNMRKNLMVKLDSFISSRMMTPRQALLTLHTEHFASYRAWYATSGIGQIDSNAIAIPRNESDLVRELALWSLLWGEAPRFRLMSECLCFVFKLANDHYIYRSKTGQTAPPLYLEVITPLHKYIHDQVQLMKEGKDHAEIIGYDDINQFFWSWDTMSRIVVDKQNIMELDSGNRYLRLKDVIWKDVFVKTYKERRTWLHLIVNFARIGNIYVSIFWYFITYDVPLSEEPVVRWSFVALGGAISSIIMIIELICKSFFDRSILISRYLLFLFIILIINSIPFYYIFHPEQTSVRIIQFFIFISLITTSIFIVIPSCTFGGPSKNIFTANYAPQDRKISIGFWFCIFGCKMMGSYFILLPIFEGSLEIMCKMRSDNRFATGSTIYSLIPDLAIIIMIFTEFVLFFWDTHFWYLIWKTIFSAVRTFTPGRSWQNNISMLQENICKKILASDDKKGASEIWEAIVDSMYHGHLLSKKESKLLKKLVQENGSLNFSEISECYSSLCEEAKRRIRFFSQSLATLNRVPLSIEAMPTFTVLLSHFKEKIFLDNSDVGLLKKYHPKEWENFQEYFKEHPNKSEEDKAREWASLRAQTLFRTISGFMNYTEAIKLLYRIKNPEKSVNEIDSMACRKFKFLIAMQEYKQFSKEVEYLLNRYPNLQIAYFDEDQQESVLIDDDDGDNNGELIELIDGKRKKRYRIPLPPGNPILGDGKSDNQNLAIIYHSGEIIQLIDANQDNYLEECLKILNILAEFELAGEHDFSRDANPSTSQIDDAADEVIINMPLDSSATESSKKFPVAIVGAHEYIFSEGYGVLGDITAGKEQIFGTTTQKMIAEIGGRLHYGHPDLLNAIFMITRGGVSKAMKSLHLNEDIFAGINVFIRGGLIKHLEYMQCGKGRDLGFESIIRYITKTSIGMGEQILSREYYYLGTQLPLHRFLTFYYVHPDFYINNICSMLLFGLLMANIMLIGVMKTALPVCESETETEFCYDITPITDWINQRIIWIIFILFVSLIIASQEWLRKGFMRSFIRLGKRLMSLSPFFEIFAIKIYSNSITTNLNFGGAQYLGTGRGFAKERSSFSDLYSRFAGSAIYSGMRLLPILLYGSLTMWTPYLTFFWFVIISLCISPFLFNPHQFSFSDYSGCLRWFFPPSLETNENSKTYWNYYCRVSMTMITNYKLGYEPVKGASRPRFTAIFVPEILVPFISATLSVTIFTFVKSLEPTSGLPNSVICLCVIAIGPILMNAIGLAVLFFVSRLGSIFNGRNKFGLVIAFVARIWAIVNLIIILELLWVIESRKLKTAILGIIALSSILRFFLKVMMALSVVEDHEEIDRIWWTGKWHGSGLGSLQIFHEYTYKIIEMTFFATDFILAHMLLFIIEPIRLIPRIEKLHYLMLSWLKLDETITRPQQNKWDVFIYRLLLFIIFIVFTILIVGPVYFNFEQLINFLESGIRQIF